MVADIVADSASTSLYGRLSTELSSTVRKRKADYNHTIIILDHPKSENENKSMTLETGSVCTMHNTGKLVVYGVTFYL